MQQNKRLSKNTKLVTLVSILAFTTVFFSIGMWVYVFRNNESLSMLVQQFQIVYFLIILYFIIIAGFSSGFFMSLTRIFFKLFFGVWVLAFIMISVLNDISKVATIIIFTFLWVYLESMLELRVLLRENFSDLTEDNKALFKYKGFFLSNDIPIVIIIISILHSIMPFVLHGFLVKILLSLNL